MYFAEFFRDTEGKEPVCGDRGVLILDGRESLHSQYVHCQEWCQRYKFQSFQIMWGESFTRSRPISPIQKFTGVLCHA